MGKSVDAVDLSSCLWAFTALGGHLILPSQLLQYILPKYGGGHWLPTFGISFAKTVSAWLEYAWQYFEYPLLSKANLVASCFCETSMPQTEMCYLIAAITTIVKNTKCGGHWGQSWPRSTKIIWHEFIIAMMAGHRHLSFCDSFWPELEGAIVPTVIEVAENDLDDDRHRGLIGSFSTKLAKDHLIWDLIIASSHYDEWKHGKT